VIPEGRVGSGGGLVPNRHGWVRGGPGKLITCRQASGPPAAQLVFCPGWVRTGTPGATLAGLAFVGPSLVLVLGLAVLHVWFGGVPWMEAAPYGVGAAAAAAVARGALKLLRTTLARDPLLYALRAAGALVAAWGETGSVVITAAGLVGLALHT
jgi:chromate transporter